MDEPQQTVGAADAVAPRADGHRSPPRREPALLRFVGILWKHRRLIALGSLFPALLFALALRLTPVQYAMTFTYQNPLTKHECDVILGTFYSSENRRKVVARLREKGLTAYATNLDGARTRCAMEKLIRFRFSPLRPTLPNTADPTTSQRSSSFDAYVLDIDIMGEAEEDMLGAGSVVAENYEGVLPVYVVRNNLKALIQEHRTWAAEIEGNRFALTADLKKEQARLEKLLDLPSTSVESGEVDVVFQLPATAENRELLPLPYQVRAAQSRIIDLEETLQSQSDLHEYYLAVLGLNDRLLRQVEDNLTTYYTTRHFLGFLDEQLAACTDEAVRDYLVSYVRQTQNLASVNTRVAEEPIVSPVAKRILERSTLAWLVLLMITSLLAVMMEYGDERRRLHRPQASLSGARA